MHDSANESDGRNNSFCFPSPPITFVLMVGGGGEVLNRNFGGGVPLVLQKPDPVLN